MLLWFFSPRQTERGLVQGTSEQLPTVRAEPVEALINAAFALRPFGKLRANGVNQRFQKNSLNLCPIS
jgi:hypothetical protein